MNGSEMVIPSEFVNQAENYFNTIDMTADESSQIVAVLKKGESFLENSGASNIADLTFAQKQTLLSYGKEVVTYQLVCLGQHTVSINTEV